MTSQQLSAQIDAIFATGLHRYEEEVATLGKELKNLDSVVAFNALFPLSIASKRKTNPRIAALLLGFVAPKCPISCQDGVRALLPEWEVDVKGTVFYLAEQFGSTVVRESVKAVQPSVTTDQERATLDAVLYWLEAYDEMNAAKR